MPRIRAENIRIHKEKTRRDLLASAATQFARYGYQDTSLADIAAEVGVGRTTVYEYFADKEAVLVTLVEETMPPVVDAIVGSIPDGIGARESLSLLIKGHLEFIADDTNVAVLIMRETPKLSPSAQEQIRKTHRRLELAILDTCRRGSESGEFVAMDAKAAAELVNALVVWAARNLLRRREPRRALADVTDTVLSLLFDGVVARR